MKKYIIFLVVCCLFLGACSQKKNRTLTNGKFECNDTVHLQANKVIESNEAFSLLEFVVRDSMLVIETSGLDSIIRGYDYPQIASCRMFFGKMGHAKGEFIVTNWVQASQDNLGLYDMMQRKMFLYKINGGEIKQTHTYPLPVDKDGLALPYTKVLQLNDSMFIMKEDGNETNLCLVNLKSGKTISRYHCDLRDGKEGSYTPYDYAFSVVGNTLCLAYNYINRVEFLNIKDNTLIPVCSFGDEKLNKNVKSNDDLPYYFIDVIANKTHFFCLKGNKGKDNGNEIYVFDSSCKLEKICMLDDMVNKIAVDKDGNIVAYCEKKAGCEFRLYHLL